jgi:hypothetical protein
MSMFGQSQRRPVFKPSVYQQGRRSRRMPRWFVLLCLGIAVGAGGVVFLQTNYGPPRLSTEQSEQLRGELNSANLERQRLQAQIDDLQAKQQSPVPAAQGPSAAVASAAPAPAASPASAASAPATGDAQTRIDELTRQLAIFKDAIPPDPRGGDIGIRWSEFRPQAGELAYRSLISRENTSAPAFQGSFTLEIVGYHRNGKRETITPAPTPVSIEQQFVPLQGSVTLPEGFTPRVATVRVLDAQDHQQALRVYYLRNESPAAAAPVGEAVPSASTPVATPAPAAAPAQPAASATQPWPPAPRRADDEPHSQLRMTIIPAAPQQ